MRIIQVGPGIHPIPPPSYGAIERHIHQLTRALQSRGVAVEILNEPVGNEYRWAPRALAALRRTDADLVHVHTEFLGARVAASHPTVYTSHMPAWATGATSLRDHWGLYWSRRTVSRARATIALTTAIRDNMMSALPGRPVHVVPNGVDTDLYRPMEKERSGRRVGMLGAVIPRKNFHVVAEALAGSDLELHIVGVQPNARYLEQVRSTHPSIQFHTGLDDADLAHLLGSMDLFVHPSKGEAFSIAVLEAMACGLAIVGSTSCIHQVDGNGRILKDGTPAAYRRAIDHFMGDDDERRRLGHRSRQLAEERYGWPAIAEQVESVYQSALEASA